MTTNKCIIDDNEPIVQQYREALEMTGQNFVSSTNWTTKILNGLNDGQKEAVLTTEGPLLIIAGAGSGKTTVLIRRVTNIINKNVDPESILLLTFTNAAADNMVERAKSFADKRCEKIQAMTYHSFCALQLRRYGKIIGLKPNFVIYSANDAEDLMRLVRAEHIECKRKGFPNAADIVSLISEAINKQLSLTDVCYMKNLADEDIELVKVLAKEYREEKAKRNVLDYDDLLLFMLKLLRHPVAHRIISNNFNYIMVDEYQDTNKIQAEILFGLANEKANIAVVGDDYQSIYAFRGADITNILNFEDQVKDKLGKTAKRVYLEVNYRSTKEILDLANSVMDIKATSGFKKTLRPRSDEASGDIPMFFYDVSQQEETNRIVEMIKGLIRDGVPGSEIAVVSRASFSLSGIESGLVAAGIDYVKRGGVKFLERKCIRDMLAYMSVLLNKGDDTKWFRILKLHPGIGDTYAKNIVVGCLNDDFLLNHRYAKRAFYSECVLLHNFIDGLRKTEDFHTQIKMMKKFYLTLCERVVREMDTDENNRVELLLNLAEASKDIDLLIDISKKFVSLSAFLDHITVDPNLDDEDLSNQVVLSTIHSAKGLEWDYVFIPDCAEGIFPRIPEDTSEEADYQEELRCFYVAITRARKGLYLFAPGTAMVYGQFARMPISSFLKGSEDYFELKDAVTNTLGSYSDNYDFKYYTA